GLVVATRTGGAGESVRDILIPAVLMVGLLLLTEVLHAATRLIRAVQSERIKDHVTELIHDKATSLDLAFYETPEYHDRLHRARADAPSGPVQLLESTGSLLQSGITLAAMTVILVRFGPWLPLALLVSTLPALYVAIRHALRQHEWRLRVTPAERRARYHETMLTTRQVAAELRVFDLGSYFR